METLKGKIEKEIKAAMLNKDIVRRDCLKFLKSEIGKWEVDNRKDISDEEVTKIIKKTVKNLETIDRDDERNQIKILSEFLPAPLSEEDIKKIVHEVVMSLPKEMAAYKGGNKGMIGLFMGESMKRTKGSGDPKLIKKYLDEFLA
jgi:uncharacterized protein YqeY